MAMVNYVSRGLVIGLAVIFVFTLLAALVIDRAEHSRANLPELGSMPAFTFTDQEGKLFDSRELQGKLIVLDFFFSRCQMLCPVMSSNMAELYRLYHSSDKIRFVSISVDPEHDSPAVMAQYAAGLGVTDKKWLFLNGPLADVARISEEGFKLAADNLPAGHSSRFVLIDPRGQIRGYYDGMSDESMMVLQSHLRELARGM